jgi:hypothetical protein
MWHLQMLDPQILAQNLVGGADSFPLLAVPFFILAGEFMNAGACPSGSSRWACVLRASSRRSGLRRRGGGHHHG